MANKAALRLDWHVPPPSVFMLSIIFIAVASRCVVLHMCYTVDCSVCAYMRLQTGSPERKSLVIKCSFGSVWVASCQPWLANHQPTCLSSLCILFGVSGKTANLVRSTHTVHDHYNKKLVIIRAFCVFKQLWRDSMLVIKYLAQHQWVYLDNYRSQSGPVGTISCLNSKVCSYCATVFL